MTAVDTVQPRPSTALRAGFADGVLTPAGAAVTQLRQLRRLLEEQEDRLVAALAADLGKPPVEAYATEIGFTIAEIDHAIAALPAWMAPERVKVPLTFKPGSARIVSQPLGVVLVIAPWNYPVQLSLAPARRRPRRRQHGRAQAVRAGAGDVGGARRARPGVPRRRAVAVVEGGADETAAAARRALRPHPLHRRRQGRPASSCGPPPSTSRR